MKVTKTTYRLHPQPMKQLSHWDLPKRHVLEDWESEDDIWFRSHGQIYNLSEFCTIGMPIVNGSQLASNGYFAIAAKDGEIHSVSITTITYNEPPEWVKKLWH